MAKRSEGVGLIVHAIIVSKISNLCDHNQPTSDRQTDMQTDGQTDDHRKTALCTKVHCAVKIKTCKIKVTIREAYHNSAKTCKN